MPCEFSGVYVKASSAKSGPRFLENMRSVEFPNGGYYYATLRMDNVYWTKLARPRLQLGRMGQCWPDCEDDFLQEPSE